MSPPPGSHIPTPNELGLASHDTGSLAAGIVPAWDAFIDVAAQVDIEAPSRLPGWTARDVLVHLGSWPEHRVLERMRAEATADCAIEPRTIDQDAANAKIVTTHHDADVAEITAALRAARDGVQTFLASGEADEIGTRLVSSALGPLPVLGLVFAAAYELAVHTLDLAPCGAPAPTQPAVEAGLAALVDCTGALAARHRIDATAAALSPEASWVFGSRNGEWTTAPVQPGARPAARIEARSAAVLLDASAGRVAVPPLLMRRELRVHDVAGLLALAPLLDSVPGLPGGAALGLAAGYLGGVGRLVRRLPRLH